MIQLTNCTLKTSSEQLNKNAKSDVFEHLKRTNIIMTKLKWLKYYDLEMIMFKLLIKFVID
jgi:hypothetical protein